MQVLKELSNISSYRPSKGLKNVLFKFVTKDGVTRKDAELHFEKINKEGQFYVIYNRLKYSLLNGVLSGKSNLPKTNRVELFKRNLQIRFLFLTGNLKAGVDLAIQNIIVAEKNNELEVVASLSKELMRHYSINDPNLNKYDKYDGKFKNANRLLQEQHLVESTYQKLILYNKTKNPIAHLEKDISILDGYAINNDYFLFRYHLYKLKSLFYRTLGNENKFIKNNEQALNFFDSFDSELPYHTKYMFLCELIPYYTFKNQFDKASNTVSKCMPLPPVGSFNWHRVLIYQCYLGFYSNEPKIAYTALKTAHSVKVKFDSKPIFEKWHIIKGYTAFFAKIKRVYSPDNPNHPRNIDNPEYTTTNIDLFKLGRFLNVDEERDNHHQKANIIILELLHLLVDGKHSKYLEKLDRIEPYISTRFKAHEFKRTRYFLRMLKYVVKGNYHPSLTQAHAEKQVKLLAASRLTLDVNVFNIEYVPFEILWQEVINILSDKHKK